jgi:hypothetical protein
MGARSDLGAHEQIPPYALLDKRYDPPTESYVFRVVAIAYDSARLSSYAFLKPRMLTVRGFDGIALGDIVELTADMLGCSLESQDGTK